MLTLRLAVAQSSLIVRSVKVINTMKNILIAVGSAALIAGTAQAATVIDEVDFRETKQCALFESRDCSLRFDGYQSSRPLVKVDVTVRASDRGTIGVFNDTSQDQPYSAGFGSAYTYFFTNESNLASDVNNLTTGANTCGTIGANSSFFVENMFDSDVDTFTLVGADTNDWLDPFSVRLFGYSDIGSFNPDVGYSFDFEDSFSVEVAYSIDDSIAPVPLPSALPVLLAGLAGFGYIARRRQRGAKPE